MSHLAARPISAICAVLFSALGCGDDARTDEASNLLVGVDVVDVDAVVAAPTLSWQLGEPQLRVGGSREHEAHHFVEITAATRQSDGTVLIADGRSGSLRRYAPTGQLQAELGTVGEGPGEFRSPSSLAWLPGDSLAVWDRRLWRTSIFSTRGSFVRSERYDPTAPGVYPLGGMWPVALTLASGARLIMLSSKAAAKDTKSGANGSTPRSGFAIHHMGTATPLLIATLPAEELVEVQAPWGPVSVVPPFAAGPRIAFDTVTGRTCVGHQRIPEILCVTDTGERTAVRWVDEPRPVDPADPAIARWRAETVAAYGAKGGEQLAQEIIAQIAIPEVHPAFGNLLFDVLGLLWVELGPTDMGREYLVLQDDFRMAGRITLPHAELLEIGADYLLALSHDDVGVEEVVLLPLRR